MIQCLYSKSMISTLSNKKILIMKAFYKNLKVFFLICTSLLFSSCGQNQQKDLPEFPVQEFKQLVQAFPDCSFSFLPDTKLADWKIVVSKPKKADSKKLKTKTFYWAEGKILPKSELKQSERYTPVFYEYPDHRCRPDTMSEEEKEELVTGGSEKARKLNPGTAMFLYDFIYDSKNQKSVKKHIKDVNFLDRQVYVHEQCQTALERVEKKLKALQKKEPAVRDFLAHLDKVYGFYWRLIAGTKRKSFHSLGLAVDLLPFDGDKKTIFWSWTKKDLGDKWVETEWDSRWMPPLAVIQAFEEEGFIWGGYWEVWDNMHFEYRPEFFYKQDKNESEKLLWHYKLFNSARKFYE